MEAAPSGDGEAASIFRFLLKVNEFSQGLNLFVFSYQINTLYFEQKLTGPKV